MKLGIIICSNRALSPYFSASLNSMYRFMERQKLEFSVFQRSQVGCPSEGLQSNLDDALAAGCTHVVFIEDDMVFPPDAVVRLLQRNRVAVGVNYPRKSPEKVPTAYALDGSLLAPGSGVEEVMSCGLGLLLVEAALLREIPRPHFEVRWNDVKQCYVTPDVYFCRLIRNWDCPLFVDNDLSREVGHVGEYVYTFGGE